MKIVYTSLKPEFLSPLVKIHRDTMKDHYNSRLGNFYTREYLKWFAKENEYQNFLICAFDEDEKRVIGYICGARKGYQSKMNRELLLPTIVSFLLRPWLIFDKRFFFFLIPKFKTLFGMNEYDSTKEFEQTLKQPIFNISTFGIDTTIKSSMNLGFLMVDELFRVYFEELKKRNAGTVCAAIRKNNTNIMRYYDIKKWTPSPVDGDIQTVFYYKEVNSK